MLLKLIGIQDLQEKRKILQCYQVDRWMSNIIAVISIRHAMWVSKSHLIYVFYLCREFFENRSDCKSV